jgi:hypothetical protein
MAQPPVPEVQFEVVRGPRRSTRRALWFSVVIVFFLSGLPLENPSRATLLTVCLVAAFTWPVLNTYFPWVDRTWGKAALDFGWRKEIDKEHAITQSPPLFRRTFVTFCVFWTAFAIGWNVRPIEGYFNFWLIEGVVVSTALLWPAYCRVQDAFTKAYNPEPIIKDEANLAKLLLGLTALLLFITWKAA